MDGDSVYMEVFLWKQFWMCAFTPGMGVCIHLFFYSEAKIVQLHGLCVAMYNVA